jgi:hypothetical protein
VKKYTHQKNILCALFSISCFGVGITVQILKKFPSRGGPFQVVALGSRPLRPALKPALNTEHNIIQQKEVYSISYNKKAQGSKLERRQYVKKLTQSVLASISAPFSKRDLASRKSPFSAARCNSV